MRVREYNPNFTCCTQCFHISFIYCEKLTSNTKGQDRTFSHYFIIIMYVFWYTVWLVDLQTNSILSQEELGKYKDTC